MYCRMAVLLRSKRFSVSRLLHLVYTDSYILQYNTHYNLQKLVTLYADLFPITMGWRRGLKGKGIVRLPKKYL